MRWQDIPGWTCPRITELYDEMAKELKPGAVAVECGVAYGKSLAYLAGVLDPGVDILAIDIWHTFQGRTTMGAALRAMLRERRMDGYRMPREIAEWFVGEALPMHEDDGGFPLFDRIEWIQARSEDVPQYLDFETDFVFLDDHHEEPSVRREIEAWVPKLKRGGVIAGHDINANYPGVERAVRGMFGPAWKLEVRPPAPGENGWGGVWKARKP